MTGRIKSLNKEKGYGFINADDTGNSYFFHRSSVMGNFDNLQKEDTVEFEAGNGPKGPRAEQVEKV